MKVFHIIAVCMLGFVVFIRFYHIIRRLWTRFFYVVYVYEYLNGERRPVFVGEWMTYAEARSAGQAVRQYIEQTTGDCNYCYEVEEKEEI